MLKFAFLSSLLLLCWEVFALSPHDPQFDWMDKAIEKNLHPFAQGIDRSTLNKAKGHRQVVRLKVEENRVAIVSGKGGACFNVLNYLCMTYGLPDLELLYLHEDGLLKPMAGSAPIFCSAKKKNVDQGILFVDWHTCLDPQNTVSYNRWTKIFDVVDTCARQIPFKEKKRQMIWRGSTSDGIYSPKNWKKQRRGKLCFLSLQHPEWIDARITFIYPHMCLKYAQVKRILPTGEYLSYEEQMPYRYQICLDGCATSYWGDRWRLLSNSVVFRHESDWEHWFYPALQPWVHYVPVKSDLSDLMEKMRLMDENDQLSEDMARNAREFALAHFTPEAMAIYCYKVLIKYAELLHD